MVQLAERKVADYDQKDALRSAYFSAENDENRQKALEDLIKFFNEQIVYWVQAKGFSPQDSENIRQEILLTLWQKIDDVREPEKLYGWLQKVVRSKIMNFLRYKKTRKSIEATTGLPNFAFEAGGAITSPTDDTSDTDDISREVRLALSQLPATERSSIEMRYFEPGIDGRLLQYDQIAQRLGRPIGTVKRQVHSAHGKLEDLLAHLR